MREAAALGLTAGPAACLEHVCCMLLFLYFPVTCQPSRAVALPNIGVPHRVTYPYDSRRKWRERPPRWG